MEEVEPNRTNLTSLTALDTTAALELNAIFDVTLEALCVFAVRHEATIDELLSRFGIGREMLDYLDFGYQYPGTREHPHTMLMWTSWGPLAERDHVKGGLPFYYHELSARDILLQLARILVALSDWDEVKGLSYDQHMALRLNLAIAWWRLLVVPEVEQAGVSAHQRAKATRGRIDLAGGAMSPQQMLNYATALQAQGVPRHRARDLLQTNAKLSSRRANQVLRQAGWFGRPGRPK